MEIQFCFLQVLMNMVKKLRELQKVKTSNHKYIVMKSQKSISIYGIN